MSKMRINLVLSLWLILGYSFNFGLEHKNLSLFFEEKYKVKPIYNATKDQYTWIIDKNIKDHVSSKALIDRKFQFTLQPYNIYLKINEYYYTLKHPISLYKSSIFAHKVDFILIENILDYYIQIPKSDNSNIGNLSQNITNDIKTINQSSSKKKINEKKDNSSSQKVKLDKINSKHINTIILDAGHGGKDPGAIAYGFEEKTIALSITKKIRDALKKSFNHKKNKIKNKPKIILTRTKDVFVSLDNRSHFANKILKPNQYGLFVSIHVNSSLNSKASGYEVYYLTHIEKNEQSRIHAYLSERNYNIKKNKLSSFNSTDVLLSKLQISQYQKESRFASKSITESLNETIKEANFFSNKTSNRIYQNRGVKPSEFRILKSTIMPSILIEVGFITNRKELMYLAHEKKNQLIASAIADGIINFILKYEITQGFTDQLLWDSLFENN